MPADESSVPPKHLSDRPSSHSTLSSGPDVMYSVVPWRDWLKRHIRIILMGGGTGLTVLVSLLMWVSGGRFISVDNAYVGADKLLISTDISGIVLDVTVHEGQEVKEGDTLFRLDPLPFRIVFDRSVAQLSQTRLAIEAMKQDYQRMLSDIAVQESAVNQALSQYERYNSLVSEDNVSRASFDQARFALDGARNELLSLQYQAKVQLAKLAGNADISVEDHPQFLQAKTDREEAKRQLDHSVIKAPFDGTVTMTDEVQPGQYLVANTAAFALVGNKGVWIDAYPRETDLTHIRSGNPVTITIDSYPDHVWTGTVVSIAPASGSTFSILPAQNASGNWVKVVQRIPVRIHVNTGMDDPVLRIGMSAVVSIDTGYRRSLVDLFKEW